MLAHSLRDAGTSKRLAVLVTLDSVSAEVITQLKVSKNTVNMILATRPLGMLTSRQSRCTTSFCRSPAFGTATPQTYI